MMGIVFSLGTIFGAILMMIVLKVLTVINERDMARVRNKNN